MIREPIIATIGTAIVFDGATMQDEGSIIYVGGYGNLTLVLEETSGDGGITANVYLSNAAKNAQPADTSEMIPLRSADGTIIDFVVTASQKGMFSLGVSAKWIAIKAKYTTAASDGNVYVGGTADMG